MRTRALAAVVVVFGLLETGCTAVGFCVGSAFSRYETAIPADRGRTGFVRTSAGDTAHGEIVDLTPDAVRITDQRTHRDVVVRRDDVVELEAKRGDYGVVGAAVGALVDLGLATFFIARTMQDSSFDGPDLGMGLGHSGFSGKWGN